MDRLRIVAPVLDAADRILDIGCGRGELLELLASRRPRKLLTGCDTDPAAVAQCLARKLNATVGDCFDAFTRHAGSFDGIALVHVIEHLQPEAAHATISACCTRLSPGGRLLIMTPNPASLTALTCTFWLDPTHVRPYPELLLRHWLEQCGLRVVDTGIALPGPQAMMLSKAALPRRWALWLFLHAFPPLRKLLRKWEEFCSASEELLIVGEKR